jgi:hypothetical protein
MHMKLFQNFDQHEAEDELDGQIALLRLKLQL